VDSFGAFGELPFATLRDSDAEGSSGALRNVIVLSGLEGYELLVELFPIQPSLE
jgi:hypothetical protein